MILFCFAGFLRFDEVRSLTFNDVLVHDDHIALCVKKSKTDQYRQRGEVLLAKGSTSACSVNMYLRYLDILGAIDDKIFFLSTQIFRSKNVCKFIYKNKKTSLYSS